MFKTSYPITREYIREASAAASLKCSPHIFFGSAAASAAFDSRTICVSLFRMRILRRQQVLRNFSLRNEYIRVRREN